MFSDLRARSLPHRRRRPGLVHAVATAVLGPALLGGAPAFAQQSGYGQTLGTTPMERQMYDGGTGRPNSGSILDSTNPIDLMNRIRRSTAMDEATPPASAIDQALQQLEAQSAPATTGTGAAPGRTQTAAGAVSGSTASPAGTTPVWSPSASPQGTSGSSLQRQAL